MTKENDLVFTGERFIPTCAGDMAAEHLHRYLFASDLVRDKAVLDIASGEGYGSSMLADSARTVVGVDISPDVVAHAAKTYVKPNLRFLEGSCSAIPLPDASVDVVVSFETLEHHDQHVEMMIEINRVLTADGILVISSPDKREYSIVPNFRNEFHVKELFADEFRQLLDTYFKSVVILSQKVVDGSAIVSSEVGAKLNIFEQSEAGQITGPTMVPKAAPYLIGVAAKQQLPKFMSSLFVPHRSRSEMGMELRRLADTNNKLRGDLEGILNSTSWRMTGPLRAFVDFVTGNGKGVQSRPNANP